MCVQRPWRQRDPWPAEAAEAHFLSGMCHMEMRSYLPSLNAFNNAINQDSNYAEVGMSAGDKANFWYSNKCLTLGKI